MFVHFQNGLLERNDIDALVNRLAEYTGWDKDSPHYHRLADVHRIFYECLKDQVSAEKGNKWGEIQGNTP